MKIRAIMAVATLAVASLHAQQETGAKPASAPASKPEGTRQPSKPPAYRFEYTLTELNGKQKVNARKFEILTTDRGSVGANSKIAVVTGSFGSPPAVNTQFQYMDVGLNANMHFATGGEGVINLEVEVSMTFLIAGEAASPGAGIPPTTTRNVKMQIATEVRPGVPTVLGTVEDVASTHSYELGVTATPR